MGGQGHAPAGLLPGKTRHPLYSRLGGSQSPSGREDLLVKGKTVPLQAWSDPEGSRKLRFSDYMTTAQDCGKVVSLTHRQPLGPGNTPGTHSC